MNISHALFWASCALCVVAQYMILRATFGAAGTANSSADVPQSPRGVEIVWALLPPIALGALLWASWRALI